VTTTTDVDVEVSTTLPLQQELAEIAEDAAELDEMEEGIEEAEDVQEALESLHAMLGRDATAGGLSQESATYFQFALNRELNRVGLKNTAPSCEAFGVSQSKLRATTLSQESVGTKIKEVWAMIVKMVTEFLAKVNEFIQTHISSAGRMVKSAQGVFEKASKAKGEKKAQTMKAGAATKLCNKDGKFENVTGGLDDVKTMINHACGEAATKGAERAKAMADVLRSFKFTNNMDIYTTLANDVVEAVSTTDDYIKEAGSAFKQDESIYHAVAGPVLPGGYAVATVTVRDDFKDDKAYKDSNKVVQWLTRWAAAQGTVGTVVLKCVKTSAFGMFKKDIEADYEEVPVASIEDCKAIAKTVEEIGQMIVGYKTKNDQVQQAIKQLREAGDQFAKNAEAGEGADEGSKTAIKSVLKIVQHVARGSLNFAKSGISYATSTGVAALSYAEKSLAQYASE
jgi:hypothetical protein